MANGVCSGVGEQESWEKVGEDGAVDTGEVGLDFFTARWAMYWSSSSCECDLDIGWEWLDKDVKDGSGSC